MTTREEVAAAHREGKFDAADAGYRHLIACAPGDASLRHDHAVLLMQHGRAEAARPLLEALVRDAVPVARSEFLLALLYRDLGRGAQALALVERYLRRVQDDPWALALAGALRTAHGDAIGGEQALRRALALEPAMPEVRHDLGIALHRQRRWREAIAAYRDAARETPDDFALQRNLARCLQSGGDVAGAAGLFAAMHRRWPQRIDVLTALAGVQAQCCDFAGEADSVAQLEALLARATAPPADERIEAFVATHLPLSHGARAALLQRSAQQVERDAAGLAPLPPRDREREPRARLRIGYLSPDFGEHAVGTLVRDLFGAHDRAAFEVYGYSLRRHRDATADAIAAGFDAFRDCEDESSAAIARAIRADRIDVLIDLGGYTDGARPEVLALRPAPLQLGYLGFIHDYAATWIDAVLLDAQVDAGEPALGPRLHLAGSLLPASRPAPATRDADRAEFGLPPGVPLLASFNNSYKLDLPLLEAWLAIARRCDEAVFVMYLPECATAAWVDAWCARGGARAALQIVPKLAPDRNRARAACCDLFLDAFRYQAGATGIAAIQAGLPILCREGATPLARLGVSLNRLLGLDELVCPDTARYVDRACELARDAAQRAELRRRLEAATRRVGLFDPRRVAAAIEACVQREWTRRGFDRTG